MRAEEENTNRRINKLKVGETLVTGNGKEDKKKQRTVCQRKRRFRRLCMNEEIEKII